MKFKNMYLSKLFTPKKVIFAIALSISQIAIAQQFSPDPAAIWKTWQSAGAATVKTQQLRDGNVYKLTPAEIIYYASVENNVSPVLLLVKMQHEQKLLSNTFNPANLQHILDRATGFGVLDRDPNHTKWAGFYPQLVAASYQFGDLWKKTYKSSAEAIVKYSTDPTAGSTVAKVYADYANKMNRIIGGNYSTTPTGWGHVDDFKGVKSEQIQIFLEQFAGPLKNKGLFSASSNNTAASNLLTPPIQVTQTQQAYSVLNYKNIAATGNTAKYDQCDPQCVGFVKNNSNLNGSYGNAKNYATNNLPGFSSLQRNNSIIQPKPGDILVWDATPGNTKYGHVALVKSVDMQKGELVRVAANESSPWCHIKEVPMKISGNAKQGYVIASPNGWVFSGWRPKTSNSSLITVSHDPNLIDANLQITRSQFLERFVGQFKNSSGNNFIEKAHNIGMLPDSNLSNPNMPITRFEVAIFAARVIEKNNPNIWKTAIPDNFPDQFKTSIDSDSVGKLRRLGVFIGEYSQEDNGLMFYPNRMASKTEVDAVLSRVAKLVPILSSAITLPTSSIIPTMSGVQLQGQAFLNQPATLIFEGKNLSPAVLVTVAACDQPKTQWLNSSQVRHQCIPRELGQKQAGWKANANDVLHVVGSVNIMPPTTKVVPPTSSMAPVVPVVTPQPITAVIAPVNITNISANPSTVQAGQAMTFSALVDNTSDVQRAELVFSDAGVVEPMTQSGNSFTRQRTMSTAGNNRSFEVRIYKKSTGQAVTRQGNYSVQNAPAPAPVVTHTPAPAPQKIVVRPTPPTAAPVPVTITNMNVNPSIVRVGGTMTFNATVNNASDVQRAELFFPDAGVVKPMTQNGNSFTYQRTMSNAGSNRPFEVRIYKKSTGQAITQSGTFTVR